MKKSAAFLLLVLAAAAMGVNLARGLHVDEYTTWGLTRFSWGDLVINRLTNGHFPTYFAFMKVWVNLFGETEAVLRLPSVIMVLAALFCFAALIGELSRDRMAVIIGGIIFALHQLVIWSGQTARPYAGILLFSIVAALGIVKWWNSRRAGWLVLTGGAVLIGMSFQALFGLVVAAFVFPLLIALRKDFRLAWPTLAALLVPVLLLTLPVIILAQRETEFPFHLGRFRESKLLTMFGANVFGDSGLWAGGWSRYVGSALFFTLLWAAWRHLGRRSSGPAEAPRPFPARAFIASWALVPAFLLVIASAFIDRSLLSQQRYFVSGLGGAVLVTTFGLLGLWRQSPRWLAGILTAAVIGMMIPATAVWWQDTGDGPKIVAQEMEQIHPPEVVAGFTHVLDYEFRKNLPARHLPLIGVSADEARSEIAAIEPKQPVWFFVYTEKNVPVDDLFRNPPDGFHIARKVSYDDARAILLLPD